MPARLARRLALVAGALAIGGSTPNPAPAQDPNAGPPGQEVLTRGPVHESFAQPVVYDPRPGPVIPKAPPDAIREVPPDQKPEGANVQWISGYWAWDDQRGDYLWISGVWRNIPPGRQWVPGYWREVDGGVQWTPGVWMQAQTADANEPRYLPMPPSSLEAGPNSPAPTASATWAPGCWLWGGSSYLWRPGFWVGVQPNWVWVPAQYAWTPSGYLFTEGYWDRPFALRGQLFAPVYFSQPVYAQPAYVYTPTIGIVASGLLGSLFVRPSVGVYYFGDYYAPGYFGAGIYPWYAFHQSRYGYDPLYSYYAVTYRTSDPGWGAQVRESYLYRRDHIDARPPRTYVEMDRLSRTNVTINNTTIINNNARNVSFAQPITRIAASDNPAVAPMRFARIDASERRRQVAQADRLQEFRQERARSEVEAAREHPAGGPSAPRPFAMPRSPVAAIHHSESAPAAAATEAGHFERAAPRHEPPALPGQPGVERHVPPLRPNEPAARPEPHPEVRHNEYGLPHPPPGQVLPARPEHAMPEGPRPSLPHAEPRPQPRSEPPREAARPGGHKPR